MHHHMAVLPCAPACHPLHCCTAAWTQSPLAAFFVTLLAGGSGTILTFMFRHIVGDATSSGVGWGSWL